MDTFNITDAFAVTGGGRFNVARITLEDDVDGVGNTFSVFFRSRSEATLVL